MKIACFFLNYLNETLRNSEILEYYIEVIGNKKYTSKMFFNQLLYDSNSVFDISILNILSLDVCVQIH